MGTDILLTLLNAIWGLVLIGIGIEMVNNPPDENWEKWTYRGLFATFGTAVIVTTLTQAVRADDAQKEARAEASRNREQAHSDQLASQSKLAYMQGTLDSIANSVREYVAHPPTSTPAKFDLAWALAIMKMAQNGAAPEVAVAQPAPSTQPLPTPQAARNINPTIYSAPEAFHDGEITGKDFGTKKGGVFVHPYLKGTQMNSDNLLGGLAHTNYVPADIQGWSDTSIQLSVPWQMMMSRIRETARSRSTAPPLESDIGVCYRIKRPDWEETPCLPPH